jgi:plastocyanin
MRAIAILAVSLAFLAAPLAVAGTLPTVAPQAELVSGPVTMSFLTGFSPPLVVAASGSSVTFTNSDSVPHTVTAIVGASFDVTLRPGASVTENVGAGPGAIVYHCTIHPWMNGAIVVTP